MATNMTWVVVFNVLASICGWTAFGLGISSLTSNNWREFGPIDGAFTIGLWSTCIGGVCFRIENADSYLNATRAFMILFVIFNFFAGLANVVSQWKLNQKAREGSAGIYSIAATFGLIGAAVYTSLGPAGDNGVGFAFAWTVVGLSYLAGLFQNLSANKMNCDRV